MSGIRVHGLLGWGLTTVGFAAGVLLLRMRNDDFDLTPVSWERLLGVTVGDAA